MNKEDTWHKHNVIFSKIPRGCSRFMSRTFNLIVTRNTEDSSRWDYYITNTNKDVILYESYNDYVSILDWLVHVSKILEIRIRFKGYKGWLTSKIIKATKV